MSYVDSVLNDVERLVVVKETYDLGSIIPEWGKTKREYIYKRPNELILINDISKRDTVFYYHTAFFINKELALVVGSGYVGKKCYWDTRYYLKGDSVVYKKRRTGPLENLDSLVFFYREFGLSFKPKYGAK